MKQFIYTKFYTNGFKKVLEKKLIETSYSSVRFNDTVYKLEKALKLAEKMYRNARSSKDFDFWFDQKIKVRDLLDKQYRLRRLSTKKLIEKLSNEKTTRKNYTK